MLLNSVNDDYNQIDECLLEIYQENLDEELLNTKINIKLGKSKSNSQKIAQNE